MLQIIDFEGKPVRLNDKDRTLLWYDDADHKAAYQMLWKLNESHAAGTVKRGPFQIVKVE